MGDVYRIGVTISLNDQISAGLRAIGAKKLMGDLVHAWRLSFGDAHDDRPHPGIIG